nr:hypothetical protein [Tanacetum cinerariifolium]
MHKAFPLPVMEFSLPGEVPTASEESSHCQNKRDATVEKIALLLKSSSNSLELMLLKTSKIYAKGLLLLVKDLQPLQVNAVG